MSVDISPLVAIVHAGSGVDRRHGSRDAHNQRKHEEKVTHDSRPIFCGGAAIDVHATKTALARFLFHPRTRELRLGDLLRPFVFPYWLQVRTLPDRGRARRHESTARQHRKRYIVVPRVLYGSGCDLRGVHALLASGPHPTFRTTPDPAPVRPPHSAAASRSSLSPARSPSHRDAISERCRSFHRKNLPRAPAIQNVRMGLSPTTSTIIHRTQPGRPSMAQSRLTNNRQLPSAVGVTRACDDNTSRPTSPH